MHRNNSNEPEGSTSRTKRKKETRKENSWISCTEESGLVLLNSYVVKRKSSGMRNVLFVNTTESAHYITNDEKKPYIYKIYDFTKGGIAFLISG